MLSSTNVSDQLLNTALRIWIHFLESLMCASSVNLSVGPLYPVEQILQHQLLRVESTGNTGSSGNLSQESKHTAPNSRVSAWSLDRKNRSSNSGVCFIHWNTHTPAGPVNQIKTRQCGWETCKQGVYVFVFTLIVHQQVWWIAAEWDWRKQWSSRWTRVCDCRLSCLVGSQRSY